MYPSTLLRLHFIRHGECEMNLQLHDKLGGASSSSPLTEKGKKQAHLLGQYLRKKKITFDKIYASTAIRAKDTAVIFSRYINFDESQIEYYVELEEQDQGDWEGASRGATYTKEVIAEMKRDPMNFKPPNGESLLEVEERIYYFINQKIINSDLEKLSHKKISLTHDESKPTVVDIAVVGHGTALKCFMRRVLNSDGGLTWQHVVDNTSITEFGYRTDIKLKEDAVYNSTLNTWHLRKFNSTSHLDAYEGN